jgi:hypothetical protein
MVGGTVFQVTIFSPKMSPMISPMLARRSHAKKAELCVKGADLGNVRRGTEPKSQSTDSVFLGDNTAPDKEEHWHLELTDT